MTVLQIQNELFKMKDTKYRDFQSKLIPSVSSGSVIGVRTPLLRSLSKELFCGGNYHDFLKTLPHTYFDENQLHAFIISGIRPFDECIQKVQDFLPFVDNWATCDQLSPVCFKKHKEKLHPFIDSWLKSQKTYTVRFAVKCLMQHFLDEDFKIEYAEKVASIKSDEYYINMMCAWYFATALAKQYEYVLPFLKENRLPVWVHNKTIQKAVESFRVSVAQKNFLKTLKR